MSPRHICLKSPNASNDVITTNLSHRPSNIVISQNTECMMNIILYGSLKEDSVEKGLTLSPQYSIFLGVMGGQGEFPLTSPEPPKAIGVRLDRVPCREVINLIFQPKSWSQNRKSSLILAFG